MMDLNVKVVIGKDIMDFNNLKAENKLNVIVFYPSDWDPDSVLLLTSFSPVLEDLKTYECSLYGCSTDSVSTHLNWIKTYKYKDNLIFPLISDPVGHLADKFNLYDREERICMKGVAITDEKFNILEVITTSLESPKLVQLVLGIVKELNISKKKPQKENRNPSQILPIKKYSKEPISTNDKSVDNVWSKVAGQSTLRDCNPVLKKKTCQEIPTITGYSTSGNQSVDSFWTKIVSSSKSPYDERTTEQRPKTTKMIGNVGNRCPVCKKSVFPIDQVFAADRKPFHKSCIGCQAYGCRNQLTTREIYHLEDLTVCGKCHQASIKKVYIPAVRPETAAEKRAREEKEEREKNMSKLAMDELKDVMSSDGKGTVLPSCMKIAEMLRMEMGGGKSSGL